MEETVDVVPQPLLVLRANGTVEHANPPTQALLSTASAIRVLGNHIQRIGQLDMATLASALRLTALGVAHTLSTWLTHAEASLLEQLVAGATLAEAAEHQQVRMSTMRTHMAHLLSKTGARRQADLMRLMSL